MKDERERERGGFDRGIERARWCLHCGLPRSLLAMKPVEIQEKLSLTKLRDRLWYVQPSCATTGDGLYEGLTWLTSNHKGK